MNNINFQDVMARIRAERPKLRTKTHCSNASVTADHQTGIVSGEYEYTGFVCTNAKFRTNGPQGGDAGHGGFLEIDLNFNQYPVGELTVNGSTIEEADHIIMRFEGDCEMRMALESLEFITTQIRNIVEMGDRP